MDDDLPRQQSAMDPIIEAGLFRGNSDGNCMFRKELFEILGRCGVRLDIRKYDENGRYIGISHEEDR